MIQVVTWARLHQTVFIPGVGEIGPKLPGDVKKIVGLKMVLDGDQVRIYANGIIGGDYCAIPKTNFLSLIVKEEKAAALDAKAAA
jgi:hypothetical protein